MLRHALSVLLLASVLAGCFGGDAADGAGLDGPGVGTFAGDDGAFVEGTVVDAEIVPVDGAFVILLPPRLELTTDATGFFRFGPVAPGDYTLVVERDGYADAAVDVRLRPGETADATVRLSAVTSDVPWHATEIYVQYFSCSWAAIQGPSAPCLVTERVVPTGATDDQDIFHFRIPAEGLADMLWESDWDSQTWGREIRRALSVPGLEGTGLGGATTWYLIQSGPAPQRAWLVPNVIHAGGNTPFDGNESAAYAGQATVSDNNNTVPMFGLMLDQRIENYLTFFHNRPGTRDFTALPDE